MKRKRYTTSFKEMVVKELATGVKVMELARKYAIPNTLTLRGHMPNHLGLETGTKDSNRQTNKE